MRVVLLTPVAALLLLVAVYLLTPQAVLDYEVPRRGYVDAHAHLVGIGAGDSGCYTHPDLADSLRFDLYLRGFGVTRDELDRHGDALIAERLDRVVAESRYVRRAVILALDGVVRNDAIDRSATRIYVPNDFAARMAERHAGLAFGASVNPERADWRRRLVDAERNGAVLVKWRPVLMDIDPSDPLYVDYYRTLVELDLPLMIQVGHERLAAGSGNALGDPGKLSLPLAEGVTVIAAHAGASGDYDGQPGRERLRAMLNEYPNLYTDIAGLTQVNKVGRLVAALQQPGAVERMVYGSSWPLQFFPLVSPFYHWPDIELGSAKAIQNIDNRLDRDVVMKKALGVPPAVFERSSRLLQR